MAIRKTPKPPLALRVGLGGGIVATDPAGHPLVIPFGSVAAAIGAVVSGSPPSGLGGGTGGGGASTSYVPMTTGEEPLINMSNGAGETLLVPYTP